MASSTSDNRQASAEALASGGRAIRERRVAGTRLAYLEIAGGGETIVWMHGMLHAGTCWNPTVELLGKNYRVIAVDLPSHGRSGRSTAGESLSETARVAAALVEEVCETPVSCIAGYSLGAAVALEMLRQRPHLAARAAFLFPPAGADGVSPLVRALMDPRTAPAAAAVARLAMLSGRAASQFIPGRWGRLVRSITGGGTRANLGDTCRLLRSAGQTDLEQVAIAVRHVPSIVLGATCDRVVPPEHAQRLAELIESQSLVWLDGQGHFAPFLEPEAVAGYVHEFVIGAAAGTDTPAPQEL